jgi:2-methylcitrate dehydratase
VEEIEFIHHHMPFHPWQEIADPPKWDPRNAETADHSMPYLIARGLIDGEIYLNSYTPEKIMDPAVRALMAKITVRPVDEWSGLGPSRITIRKKTGEEKSWDSLDGERHSKPGHFATRMTSEEIHSKFNRAADFMSINEHQRDKARKQWADLRTIEDIAIPMRTLANFGKPKAL